jgi:hypothetical protein
MTGMVLETVELDNVGNVRVCKQSERLEGLGKGHPVPAHQCDNLSHSPGILNLVICWFCSCNS